MLSKSIKKEIVNEEFQDVETYKVGFDLIYYVLKIFFPNRFRIKF